jgi:hypothetical protein
MFVTKFSILMPITPGWAPSPVPSQANNEVPVVKSKDTPPFRSLERLVRMLSAKAASFSRSDMFNHDTLDPSVEMMPGGASNIGSPPGI